MPRDERGRFVAANGITIQLPSFINMIKYLIISIVVYPWYIILIRGGKFDRFMNWAFGDDQIQTNVSMSKTCIKTPFGVKC